MRVVRPRARSDTAGCDKPMAWPMVFCEIPALARSAMSDFQSMATNLSHKRLFCNRQCDPSIYHNCDMERIGEKIKILRESFGDELRQEALAKRAGVSQTTIADLERGRNESSRKLTDIARVLLVTADELVALESSKLIEISQKRRTTNLQPSDDQSSDFLSRKSPAPPAHNVSATKSLFDLARELERGDLPPEVEAMLKAELDAKSKAVRALLSRLLKESKP